MEKHNSTVEDAFANERSRVLCFLAWQNALLLLISILLWKRLMLVGFEHVLVDVVVAALEFSLVCLEADLQDPVAEGVAVEALDGDQGLVIVGHRHETEPLALVGLQITDHLKCSDFIWISKFPRADRNMFFDTPNQRTIESNQAK